MEIKLSKIAICMAALWISGMSNIAAQNVILNIKNKGNEALIGTAITLVNTQDSTQYYNTSDINGQAIFTELKNGPHHYKISYLGYEDAISEIEISEQNRSFSITLTEGAQVMETVNIVAKRPLMRQDGERTIVDPEPLLGSISNTLELLTMTPGLFVDDDGNVFLGNSTPAAIHINGREQRMSSADIANVLRSLPPGNILRIEIIRNPSTKYDASSTGGILNVVLKKGVKIGRFGSVNTGFNQGQRGNRFFGVNLYDTGSKSTYYINANYSHDGGYDELSARRLSDAPFELRQEGVTDKKSHVGYLGWGYNTQIKEKWSIGYDGRLNTNKTNNASDFVNATLGFTGDSLAKISNIIQDKGRFINHNHDMSLDFSNEDKGDDLKIKLGFAQSFNDATQDFNNRVIFPQIAALVGNGLLESRRNFGLFQVDYTKEYKSKWRLETGLKSTLQYFKSDNQFFAIEDGETINDEVRNNKYTFRESLNAAYIQTGKKLKYDISFTTGFRVENTYMNGEQNIPIDTQFIISRTDLFPYLFASRKIMKIAGYELRGTGLFRKTLARPSYQNLSPGITILDPFNYRTGNPSLNPQFTDTYEFNIGFDDVQILAVGKNYTNGIISDVLYNDPNQPFLTVNTFDNIGRSEETYFRVLGAVPPIFKYFFVLGGQYNHLNYSGNYQDTPINFNRGSWQFFTFHRYKITDNTQLMMYGFLLKDGQRNFLELGDFGMLNFTLSQQLWDKKVLVSVFYRDVLRTMENPFRLEQGNVLFEGRQYRDQQRYGVNIRYNFGVKTKKEQKGMFEMENGG